MPRDGVATAAKPARLGPGVVLLLALAVFACFLPALGGDFVLWDDDMNFTDNPDYRGLGWAHLRWMFSTVYGGHYQPLSWVTFALDYLLWGMNPTGYHLTNLVLHAVNAVLVYALIAALVPRIGRCAALIGALFFAIHPLRVESVAWATERRDVLSGVFYLLALLTYLRLVHARQAGGAWRAWWATSIGCFALSLLAKAWGVTLPLILLVLDVYPLRRARRGTGLGTVLVEKIPYAVLALGGAVLANLASIQVPARRTLAQEGMLARTAQAAYGLVFYAWKTVVPVGLSPVYILEQTVSPTETRYVISAVIVLALAATLVLARRRWPWAAAAAACYLLVLVTVLGFVQTGPQVTADRYTYLASVPWAVVVAAGLDRLARRRAVLALSVVALAILGALTFAQTRVWHDSRTLWQHALAVDPDNYIAHVNRGSVRETRGNLTGAFDDFTVALRLNPVYSLAWYRRATERLAWGDDPGAIADYTAALGIKPTYLEAYNNRGLARQRTGDLVGAIADFKEALRLSPEGWPPRAMVQGNLALAVRQLAGQGHE